MKSLKAAVAMLGGVFVPAMPDLTKFPPGYVAPHRCRSFNRRHKPAGTKLQRAAHEGKLGYNTRGGQGVISRYFITNRKDQNVSAMAAGKKPVHHGRIY